MFEQGAEPAAAGATTSTSARDVKRFYRPMIPSRLPNGWCRQRDVMIFKCPERKFYLNLPVVNIATNNTTVCITNKENLNSEYFDFWKAFVKEPSYRVSSDFLSTALRNQSRPVFEDMTS